jgi:predicted ATPase
MESIEVEVIYQAGLSWKQSPLPVPGLTHVVVLSHNNWDDFGFKTTLNAAICISGEKVLEFALKIYIPVNHYTSEYLDSLIKQGLWDGVFPIPNTDYISLPSDIAFYEILVESVGVEEAKRVLLTLRDVGFLQRFGTPVDQVNSNDLTQTDAWGSSLTREAGAKKSFYDGWRVFEHSSPPKIRDFRLNLLRKNNSVQPINFAFNSEVLPYDINVLIGPNGVGKSYCLKTLVEYWLAVGVGAPDTLNGHAPFDVHPNVSKLILVSYSPFEEFTLDLENTVLREKDAYRYFGFRYQIEEDGATRIGINRNLPASDSVNSLAKSFYDDEQFGFMRTWQNKVEIITSILQSAITFDHLALAVEDGFVLGPFETIGLVEIEGRKYAVPNSSDDFRMLEGHIIRGEGVIFLNNGIRVQLSSGQRLFCYIVINVVGEIKRDSLVVIDEPELFLHPRLEVEFVGLLKKINSAFNSCAILATHSLSIARETPSKCVHVLRQLEDGLDVIHPPFETFGGDMQRISTYVFGDDTFSKPFDEWLTQKLDSISNPHELIRSLGREVNEELVIKILNYEKAHGRENSSTN